jgi:phosphopentomutase
MKNFKRVFILVIDGCGVGAAPDVQAFGDLASCNTLSNTASAVGGLHLPNLERLGLGNITSIAGVPIIDSPLALHGKLQEKSKGKDTQTGHWEMMGVISEQAFPLYPDGFSKIIIDDFVQKTGCKNVLGNKPASGTVILEELGEEHQRTGYPIVYTSGDSVFQIACHVETVPLPKLYEWCEIARAILQGGDRVGRVIARPFTGSPGNYKRLSGERRDYGVAPPRPTLLDKLVEKGFGVFGIGKIEDIFFKQGLSHAKHTGSNQEGLELTLNAVQNKIDFEPMRISHSNAKNVQLTFTNLVDTDSLFGHRRDVKGYARALVEIDLWLSEIMNSMAAEDLLIISSDHGNDPTARGTDHTREFVPLLAYSPAFSSSGTKSGARDIGTRQGFVDIAASIADWFGIEWNGPGISFLRTSASVLT